MTDVYIVEHRQQRKGDKALDSVVMGVFSTLYRALQAVEGLYPELRDSVRQDGPEWYFIDRNEVDGQGYSRVCAVDQNGMVSTHLQPVAGVFGPEDGAQPLADFMQDFRPQWTREVPHLDPKVFLSGEEESQVDDDEDLAIMGRFKIGDHVRSVVRYRRGQVGVVTRGPTGGYLVAIDGSGVECTFDEDELELVRPTDDTVCHHTFSRAPTAEDAEALGLATEDEVDDEVVERLALFPGVTDLPSDPELLDPHRTPFRVAFRWTRCRPDVWLKSCVSDEIARALDQRGGDDLGDYGAAVDWLKACPYYQEHLRKQREGQSE